MRKSVLYLLLCLPALAFAPKHYIEFRPSKDYALFFAVQDYQEWGNLRNPIKDAQTIAENLKDSYGFEIEVVTNPTKRQIYDKLDAYVGQRVLHDEDSRSLGLSCRCLKN